MEVDSVPLKKLQIYITLMMFTVFPAYGGPPIFEGTYARETVPHLQDAHTCRQFFIESEVRHRLMNTSDQPPWLSIIWSIPGIVNTEDPSVTWKRELNNFLPLSAWQEKKGVAAAGYTASGRDKLFRLNAYSTAIADFDKALSLTPESPGVYYERATAKLLFGNAESAGGNTAQAQRHYHAAIQDYTQVIARSPERTDAYLFRSYAKFKLGTLVSGGGNTEEAQHHYHTALADCNQAIARYRKKDALKAALAIATDVGIDDDDRYAIMDLRGSYAFAHYMRGLAKESLGHHTSAAADFRKAKALELVPGVGPWTFRVGWRFRYVNLR